MLTKYRQIMIVLLGGVLCLTIFALIGCKKKAEPVIPAESTVAEVIEQKLCPIMDSPINKDLYTEYKGKKVYFCCPGCKEKFEQDPEKYLEKLPQFNK